MKEKIQRFPSSPDPALCGMKCYTLRLNRMTLHTVLAQMNGSHKFFTWGFKCTLWNLRGFLQGTHKLKKDQYLYFFLFSKLSFKPGRETAVQVMFNEEMWITGYHSTRHHFWGVICTYYDFLKFELLRINIFFLKFPACLLVYLMGGGVLLLLVLLLRLLFLNYAPFPFFLLSLVVVKVPWTGLWLPSPAPAIPNSQVDEDQQAKCGSQLLFWK